MTTFSQRLDDRAEERVPFAGAYLTGRELANLEVAVRSGRLQGGGEFSTACEDLLREQLGAPHVRLTHSCTAALEAAANLCEIGHGDEFLVPSFSYVTTASAFVARGATPVFVDVDPATLNLDVDLVRKAITDATRAIVVVHYAGVLHRIDELVELAREYGLRLVEDAAQAIGSSFRGQPAGTFGDLSTFSFHETKNVHCGEGGALVVNEPELIARSEIILDKGTDRQRFVRGEVAHYTWQDIGSSYRPSELCAAYLLPQLEDNAGITGDRHALYARYEEAFDDLRDAGRIRLAHVPAECEHNAHSFRVMLSSGEECNALKSRLRDAGIDARTHFVPLHSSPFGNRVGRLGSSMKVTDEAAACLLRLPLHVSLDAAQQEYVVDSVRRFFGRR